MADARRRSTCGRRTSWLWPGGRRPQPQPRRANAEGFVNAVTATALATPDERLRIEVLTLLDGVDWPTASVVLHFCHADPYPILDYRAIWSLASRRRRRTTSHSGGPTRRRAVASRRGRVARCAPSIAGSGSTRKRSRSRSIPARDPPESFSSQQLTPSGTPVAVQYNVEMLPEEESAAMKKSFVCLDSSGRARDAHPGCPCAGSVSVSLSFFHETLAPHGRWVMTASYGEVWAPAVAVGWAPYVNGEWVYSDWGWTWVSYDSVGGDSLPLRDVDLGRSRWAGCGCPAACGRRPG